MSITDEQGDKLLHLLRTTVLCSNTILQGIMQVKYHESMRDKKDYEIVDTAIKLLGLKVEYWCRTGINKSVTELLNIAEQFKP